MIIILLLILPLFYKVWFWLYTIQLKEYRGDRFSEYIDTPQWKTVLYNKLLLLESLIFLISSILFIANNYIFVSYYLLLGLLVLENFYVLFKIVKKQLFFPKITSRMILLITVLTFILISYIYISFTTFLFSLFVLLLLLIPYLFIFISNLLILPIVLLLKRKKIKKAMYISRRYNNVIKIWITWSYWKSSVKEILSSFLEFDWKTLKSPKNINTEMWISDLIIRKLNQKFKYFIAEMWAYKIWEIKLLWEIVDHKYWFLTWIWNQHIWLFWSQSNIIEAKKEIWDSILKNNWVLYINNDNNYLRLTKFKDWLNIVKYWFHTDSDALVEVIDIINWITEFKFKYKSNSHIFKTNLIWEHNILNLAWVLAFCFDQKFSTNQINKVIKNLKLPDDTCEIITHKWIRLINNTYNLSVDSLKSWIKILNSFDWNKIIVSDDILELWVNSEVVHFDLWKFIWRDPQITKVLLCWVNYREAFIDWLLEWWFNGDDLIDNLDKVDKNTTILFAWRRAKKYFNDFIKNAK